MVGERTERLLEDRDSVLQEAKPNPYNLPLVYRVTIGGLGSLEAGAGAFFWMQGQWRTGIFLILLGWLTLWTFGKVK